MMLAKYTKENQCLLCPRNCIINKGKRGFCNAKKNINGKIYALNYGKIIGLNIDPIEKKPLYHFLPGQKVLSFGTLGCNFDCLGCQNYEISRGIVNEKTNGLITPQEIIKIAKENNIKIIAYTYTEPTIFFEYMIDVAKLAKNEGIKNIVVSNGYINPKPLKELLKVIDAFNIDLKFIDEKSHMSYTKGLLKPVLDNIITINKSDSHLEITNLVINDWNDDKKDVKEYCSWIKKNIGRSVPIHFSAFSPNYKLINVKRTTLEKLEEIKSIAKEYFDYVYLGNVNVETNTICPKCNKTLIRRNGYSINLEKDFDGVCECGNIIPGVWNKNNSKRL